jgi:serine/threonine protein kinase
MSSSSSDSDSFEVDFKGAFIRNKYIPIKEIDIGGKSAIWLTYCKNTKEYVILKQCNNIGNGQDHAEEEIKYVKKLCNSNVPNVMRPLDQFEFENYICFIYPLMLCSLYDVIKQKISYPVNTVKKITVQLLHTLNKLHNELKILHMDIKPENILIHGEPYYVTDIKNNLKVDLNRLMGRYSVDTAIENFIEEINKIIPSNSKDLKKKIGIIPQEILNNPTVSLIDFGSSCDVSDRHNQYTTTSYYIAPEDILDYEHLDNSPDLWALGCTIYELLTGKILFDPDRNDINGRHSHHLYFIQTLLGPPTQNYLNNCKYSLNFYKSDGRLKGWDHFRYEPIHIALQKNGINEADAIIAADFISLMLRWEPKERASIDTLLKHKWINEYVSQYKISNPLTTPQIAGVNNKRNKKKRKKNK